MDLQVKRKKIFILCSIFIIIILFCGIIIFMLRDQREYQGKLMEGTVIEREDNYLSICNEAGTVYVISLEMDYEGVPLSALTVGDWVKVWYKGEIAETYPGQIVAFKIEK